MKTREAAAMSNGLYTPTEKPQPTNDELADAFAAQARKSALMRAPDGLQVFEALAKQDRKPADS
jgi:hypothetical protein